MLAEDIKVRDFLKRKLAHASVGRVLIERPAKDARITIFSARPGVVIGKKGEEIEALKAELRRILGAQGIKIMSSGRLNGIEIARTEWYREGRVPLHTLRADIDYGLGEAKTNYGVIGIKVWVYKGEILPKAEAAAAALLGGAAAAPVPQPDAPAEPRRAKKPAPKAGAKRGERGGPARPRGAAGPKKEGAAPAPKTTVKKPKKIVKEEGEKPEGEKKE